MHTRQSGAAHVPIMFFLILLVMFLGALGFAYVVTDANTNLRKENAKLSADNKKMQGKQILFEHYTEDVGSVLGAPGKYTTRPEVNAAETYAGQDLDGVVGVMSPADLKTKIGTFGTSIEIGATKGLDDLLTAAASKVAQLKKRISEVESERDQILTQKNETDAKFAEATSSHSRTGNEWRQTLEQARADFDSIKNGQANTIGLLQQNLKDRETNLSEEKEARSAERKQLRNEIGKLQMQNTALVAKDRMRNPPSAPDGRIIVAQANLPTAYIDLGRKDMLQKGTVFQIKNRNETAIKGYATVTRVEQDRAEVTLSQIADGVGDPVKNGDQIYNDLYSPGDSNKRTIYLLGRFSYPYHKPQLEALLKGLGNTVVAKMGPGVDTVILGDNAINEAGDGFTEIQESDDYKLANALGVEFVPMRKIRDIVRP